MNHLYLKIVGSFIAVILPLSLALGIKYKVTWESKASTSTLVVLVIWVMTLIVGMSYVVFLAISIVHDWNHFTFVESIMCSFAFLNIVVQLVTARTMYRQINAPALMRAVNPLADITRR